MLPGYAKLPRLRPLPALLLLSCAVGTTIWLAAAHASSTAAPRPVLTKQSEAVQSARAASKKETLPSVAVTLTRRGFEPANLTMPGGRFFLTVENRSGNRGLTLRIDPEHGERVREVKQPEDELDWTDELRLTPGRYTLTTSERPDWVCHVTVTAQ